MLWAQSFFFLLLSDSRFGALDDNAVAAPMIKSAGIIHHIPFALTNPPQNALGTGSISVQFLRYAPKKYMEVPKNWKHCIGDHNNS